MNSRDEGWRGLWGRLWRRSKQEERQASPRSGLVLGTAVAPRWEDVAHKLINDSTTMRQHGVTQLKHVQQLSNWDCGVACLLMAVDWLCDGGASSSQHDKEEQRDWMLKQAGTQSIWTIDLVWILYCLKKQQRLKFLSLPLSFSYLLCSQTLSVNEDLSDYSYYRDAFSQDRIRVQKRFAAANELQLPVFQTSHLSLEQVTDCIRRNNCIAIALVDNKRLIGNTNQPYCGHYIVLAGISCNESDIEEAKQKEGPSLFVLGEAETRSCLVVKNPGSTESVSYFTLRHFERAWRAKGTDEDIIFIAKNRGQSW